MALTIDTFYEVVVLGAANAAWTGYPPPYPQNVPNLILDGMINAPTTSFVIYCVDPTEPASISLVGGGIFSIDSNVFDPGSMVTLTTFTLVADDTTFLKMARQSDGSMVTYDTLTGAMRHYSGAEVAALNTFTT